ncbi:hypothetical protein MSNKSG1_16401 [Marinobacter santoriniensis NKSG1]|uniref:CHAD domain-containing protein n=1 Tax=Marinobacter santoriniensis NKSG1 TaxID=1288826 RepID=M7CMC4_9GAMM|nr:CHAD domain-containing protein [Marinobacter santoriniensis]EMP54329.1 hypothetical protein MSNKSG1_16401 [Marinobacter santoriniensis NKSG1]
MKHLFLVRHAKSSWTDDTLRDRDRPLNHRGESQLPSLSRALTRLGAFGGRAYASSATRARTTLEGILPPGFPTDRVFVLPELYTFDHRRLLRWLQNRDESEETVLLIGHNPALIELAGHLLGADPHALPTASIAHINLPDKPWRKLKAGKGTLEVLLTPKDFSYQQFNRKRRKDGSPEADIVAALDQQLRRIRDLERGVRVGVDDEFLHQYRVAIRRSRAIAESVGEVTRNHSLSRSIKALKRHARATSRLRDLHVFRQQLTGICQGNEELATALATWAETEIDKSHSDLLHHLDSRYYRNSLDDWSNQIHARTFRKLTRGMTSKDIRNAVARRIKEFNRRDAELLHSAPDEPVHSQRKRIKRIRYLMELDRSRWQDALGILKKRQELYGRFQDLHVQMELLDAFRDSAPDVRPEAIAGLKAELEQQKADVKRRILALGGLDGAAIRHALL